MENVELKALKSHQMIVRVEVYCANCKKKFTFHARNGFSTYEPSIDFDGDEIRIPVDWPQNDDDEEESEILPPPEGFL